MPSLCRHDNGVTIFEELDDTGEHGGALMVSAVVRAPPETCFHVRGLRWHHVAFHKVHAGIHWDQQGGTRSRGRASCDRPSASTEMRTARLSSVRQSTGPGQKVCAALSTVGIGTGGNSCSQGLRTGCPAMANPSLPQAHSSRSFVLPSLSTSLADTHSRGCPS